MAAAFALALAGCDEPAPEERLSPEARNCAFIGYYEGHPFFEDCLRIGRETRATSEKKYGVTFTDCRLRNGHIEYSTVENCSKLKGTAIGLGRATRAPD